MTRISILLFGLCYMFMPQNTIAQGIHYTPFYTTPTALNPAFTGMFDGKIRAGMIYRNQWASVTVPYVTLGLSADMPILTLKDGSYVAAGIQAMKDKAGDGNLSNFTALGSISYHRSLHKGSHPIDAGLGIQAGYSQNSIDMTRLYFGSTGYVDPLPSGTFANPINAYPVALGLTISQRGSGRFDYTLGVSAQNILQTGDDATKQKRMMVGLERSWSLVYGANWLPTKRLKISPALVFVTRNSVSDLIAGSEFGYRLSRDNTSQHRSTSVFIAGWYRSSDNLTSVAGIEHRSIKLGLSYDYYLGNLSPSSGNAGAEIFIRYIAPFVKLNQNKRPGAYSRF